jgi:F-type H+-transporting ATPase subunit b
LEALGINLGYLVSQIINFTLLAVLLYFVAYKPVMHMLDERSERIRRGLEDAELASKQAAEMEQRFEQHMSEARKEGQEIIAQATQMSERARQEMLERAREEARLQVEKAREEIGREREQAMAELRQEVADLALLISEKVIGQTLDEQRQRKLIADFLEQTGELK